MTAAVPPRPREDAIDSGRMAQACELPPRQPRRNPGPVYWACATAVACAAAAPFPFFWAPPLWVGFPLAPPTLPVLPVLGTILRSLETGRPQARKMVSGARTGPGARRRSVGGARIHVA